MKAIQYCMLAVAALSGSQVYADVKLGSFELAPEVELGVQGSSGAERQSARSNEYTDIANGVLGGARVSAEHGSYYMDFSASHIGLGDQSFLLKGGRFGEMSYKMFYNSLPHNYSINGVTLFDGGVGSNSITTTLGTATQMKDPTTWLGTVNYGIKQNTLGIDGTYQIAEPFELNLGFSRVGRTGIKSTGGTTAFSSSSTPRKAIELPEPVDYTTNNANLGFAMKGENWLAHLQGNYSAFSNANTTLTFDNPYNAPSASTQRSQIWLAPSNNMWKVGLGGTVQKLPLDSSLTAKVGYTRVTASYDMGKGYGVVDQTGTGSAGAGVDPTIDGVTGAGTYQGKLTYGSANVAWNANPIGSLDTKVFYNYLRKWNDSSNLQYGTTFQNSHFNYLKSNPGVNMSYRLPFATKLAGGYEYQEIRRFERTDADTSRENTYYAKLSNTLLSFLEGSVKYQYVARTSDPLVFKTTGGLNYQPFDAVSKVQNKVDLELSSEPIHNLDVSAGLGYRKASFGGTEAIAGRGEESTTNYSADVAYEMPRWFKASVYGSVDRQTFSNVIGATTGVVNRIASEDSTFYTYGFGVTVPIKEKKWDVYVGWEQAKNVGMLTFDGSATPTTAVPILNLDQYVKSTVNAKTKYQIMDNLTASVGYKYQKLDYSDPSFENYIPANATGDWYLTGYGADMNYEGHTGYVTASYTF